MAYVDFKDLKRRLFSDKFLRDKALNIAKNPIYHGYQRGLASMVYKFFDNYTKQLLETLKKEQFILDLKTISGVSI